MAMPTLGHAAAWAVLLIAGLCEVAWAVGPGTEGFTRPAPTVDAGGNGRPVLLLAWSLKTLPVGTAYAVWTGIGAVGTAMLGMVLFGESREAARPASIALIVAGIPRLETDGEVGAGLSAESAFAAGAAGGQQLACLARLQPAQRDRCPSRKAHGDNEGAIETGQGMPQGHHREFSTCRQCRQ